MKILLVRPHITSKVARRLQAFLHLEPLSLEIVASGIPAQHDVEIVDLASARAPIQEFRTALTNAPDVIGFTAYSVQAQSVKQLVAIARVAIPSVYILVGGIHATIAPADLKQPGYIDLVVRGEGGSVMPLLMDRLQQGLPPPEHPAFLSTSSARFDELAQQAPPPIPTYDQIPIPRRDLVDRSKYFCIWHGEPGDRLPTLFPQTASLRTSVGCPNRCTFCVVPFIADGKYRQRDPEEIVHEIAAVPEEHIYFVDDEMFINPERVGRIAELLIENGIRKKYISWARADTICRYPDLFSLWKRAGLSLLYVGLESMNPATLKDYNKGIEPDVNRKAVEILAELGIGLHAALMINPDFTEDDFRQLRETVEYVTPAEISFTVFSPPPGTELWEKYQPDFVCEDPYAFYDCQHTLVKTHLPLKKFYGAIALALLCAFRRNPWLANRVRVPVRDLFRFLCCGFRYGWSLRTIYRDYKD